MSRLVHTAAIGITLTAAGCAIHPLPENVTGVPTDMIARKIRCEARDAVKKKVIAYLKFGTNDASANGIGLAFEDGSLSLTKFSPNQFRGPVKLIVQKFEDTAIGYDFSFDMTEVNNLDASLDLTKTISRGTGTSGLSAGIDRTRQNVRSFTITDTFRKLLTEVKDDYCEFTYEKNYIYPITGKIGVDEMIDTFVDMAQFGNLSGKSNGPPTMADQITFTTKLSGAMTPKVVLTPIGNAIQLADASLNANASRTDIHRVIVALALPVTPKAAASTGGGGQAKVGSLVNASGTSAEVAAAHTIEQFITRFELGKAGIIIVPSP